MAIALYSSGTFSIAPGVGAAGSEVVMTTPPLEGHLVVVGWGTDNRASGSAVRIKDEDATLYPGANIDDDASPSAGIEWKLMGATPDGSFYVTHTDVTEPIDPLLSDRYINGFWMIFSGVDGTTPVEVIGTEPEGDPGLPNPPSITTLSSNAVVLIFGAVDDDTFTPTAPTGFTDLIFSNAGLNDGTNDCTVMAALQTVASPSAVDADAFGGSGSDAWYATAISIKSASSGSELSPLGVSTGAPTTGFPAVNGLFTPRSVTALQEHPSRSGATRTSLAGWRHRDIDWVTGSPLAAAQIVYVDNLNASGAGSLRAALDTADNGSWLFIIPRVAGRINITSAFSWNRPRTWYAGECGPGQGLELVGYHAQVRPDQIVIGHMGFRPDYSAAAVMDGLQIREVDGGDAEYAIIYNCSIQGSGDELVSVDAIQDASPPVGGNSIRYVTFLDTLMGLAMDDTRQPNDRPHNFGPYVLDQGRGIEFARSVIAGARFRCVGIEVGGSATMFSNLVVGATNNGGMTSSPMCILEGSTKVISSGSWDTTQDAAWNVGVWDDDIFLSWGDHENSTGLTDIPEHPELIAGTFVIQSWRDDNYMRNATWAATLTIETQTDPKGTVSFWNNRSTPTYAPNNLGWTPDNGDLEEFIWDHVGKLPRYRDELDELTISQAKTGPSAFATIFALPSYSIAEITTPQTDYFTPVSDPFTLETRDGVQAPRIVWQIHDDYHVQTAGGLPYLPYSYEESLTPTGIATGAPTVGNPDVGQTHQLTATGIATGAPAVGSPTFGQTHQLTATGIATGAPAVGSPTFGQTHQLTATGIATGAPTVGAPEVGQEATLTATGIATGAPTVGNPAVGQTHQLTATGIATGAPTVGAPSVGQGEEAAPVGTASGSVRWWVQG